MTTYYYYKTTNFNDSWSSVASADIQLYTDANIAIESTSSSSPAIEAGIEGITKIVIKNIENIPADVFKNCTNLKTLTIGAGVISIGANAFYSAGISTLTIPASVKTIGDSAFAYAKLQTLTISDNDKTISINAFLSCKSLNNVIFTTAVNSMKIHWCAFAQCDLLALTIQSGTIYDEQFKFSNELTGLTLGNTVGFSGDKNFNGCVQLKKLKLGLNLTSIPANAFNNCRRLTEVIIPDLVTDIGNDAFTDCIGLINLTIGAKVKLIGINTFKGCKALNNLTIGNEVTDINGGAFEDCLELAEVIIPQSVTYIGDNAFKNCKSGLTIIVDNDDIVFQNRLDTRNSSSAFDTANTTLYINKDMLCDKSWVFGGAVLSCTTSFKIPSLSFEYVLAKQGVTGDSIKMPKKATIKHDYEMKQTPANKFSDIFSGITIIKAPDNSKIRINITGASPVTTLEIPIPSSVGDIFYTTNSVIIEAIIDKVGSNIKSADYTLSGLSIKDDDPRDFITSFKRISVDIGANNTNKDTDIYKVINKTNTTFNTYQGSITVTATIEHFRSEFIKYFKNKKDKFLTIFDLLKYSSMDVPTYKTYDFNIYTQTGFEFDTESGTTTVDKLIKIN